MTRWACLLILAVAPSLAQAASFDCTKATAPVDELICADPALSQLDESLTTAFKQAKAQTGTDGQALLAQQRQWLRGRQAACAVPPALPNDKSALTACLAQQYQSRLEALAHPPQAVKGDDSLCQIVAAGLREKAKVPRPDWDYPSSVLTEGATPILNTQHGIQGRGDDAIKYFKNKYPDQKQALDQIKNFMNDPPSTSFTNIANTNLYILENIEGTMRCTSQLFIRANTRDGLKIIRAPDPIASEDTSDACGSSFVIPATIAGHPAVVVEYGHGQEDQVPYAITAYLDPDWGATCQLELTLGHRQAIEEHHCADGQCDRFDGPALTFAKSFLESPKTRLGLPLKSLTPEQAATWKSLKAATPEDGAEMDMPIIGKQDWTQAYTHYASNSYRFPAVIDGQLILVRIGEATLGWRDSENVLVSFTALKDGKAVPVAGAYVEKHRTAPTSITVK